MKKKPAYNQEWLDMEMKRRLAETPVTYCNGEGETPDNISALMYSMHPNVEKSIHIFILHEDCTIEWRIRIGDNIEDADGSQIREFNSFLPNIRDALVASPTKMSIYEVTR